MSTNAGGVWQKFTPTVYPWYGHSAWSPNNPDVAYARDNGEFIKRSVDKGATWTNWFAWPLYHEGPWPPYYGLMGIAPSAAEPGVVYAVGRFSVTNGMDSVIGTATEVENDTVLTLTSGVGGAVLSSGASIVTIGVATQITAIAGNGYAFTAWQVISGSAIIADIHAATTTVTIDCPATLQAYFAESAPPSGTVWGWGQNTYGQLGDGTI